MMWIASGVIAGAALVAAIFGQSRTEGALAYGLLFLSSSIIAPEEGVLFELIAGVVMLALMLWHVASVKRARRHEPPTT